MSEMKHTPGPWYTLHGQISSETSSHGCIIANCNRTSRGINDAEVEANARLIAAAPDLLECVRWACAWANGWKPKKAEKEKFHKQCLEAITKATKI